MSYFDIDCILSEEDRVSCKWLVEAPDVGAYLDQSSASPDIEVSQVTDLPVFLARTLKSKNYVEVMLPRSFGKKFRDGLKADALREPLRDRSPYYYEVGLAISDLVHTDETLTLPADILSAFAVRVHNVLTSAPKNLGKDVVAYRSGLTETECRLFDNACRYAALNMKWRRRQHERLQSASNNTRSHVIATAALPLSRGQKRDRNILALST